MGFGGLLGVVAHTHLEGCLNCVAKGFLWVAVVEVDEVSVATSSGRLSLSRWSLDPLGATRDCMTALPFGFVHPSTLLPTHVGSNPWDLVDYSESLSLSRWSLDPLGATRDCMTALPFGFVHPSTLLPTHVGSNPWDLVDYSESVAASIGIHSLAGLWVQLARSWCYSRFYAGFATLLPTHVGSNPWDLGFLWVAVVEVDEVSVATSSGRLSLSRWSLDPLGATRDCMTALPFGFVHPSTLLPTHVGSNPWDLVDYSESVAASIGIHSLAGLWVQLARSWCYSRFYAGFATLLPTHVGSNPWDLGFLWVAVVEVDEVSVATSSGRLSLSRWSLDPLGATRDCMTALPFGFVHPSTLLPTHVGSNPWDLVDYSESVAASIGIHSLAGLWVQLARSWCYSRFYAGFATLLPTHVGSNLWDLVDYSES
ncbi:hypothetical protein BCR33DRAFT_784138 [Rhizoclosmatium globosum]|uniref:Uncharacterized protein n=1 Tax=Rhizoclosmatium globosum TaxID=329046 RepID=A0A1Y2CG59_9FUNG|nr:hypothetical protein BCR33DRAFT_784138 [Rhizoclosmatium globosum]|eukprot:ORY46021.1 hypothetical protein BCR33DRAFT_784138 [Rhizoclosmatium globosum]